MGCFSIIDIGGWQLNRLDPAGNVMNGAEDVIMSCSLVGLSVTPNRADDRDNTAANARGGNCARRFRRGIIESYAVTATLCAHIDSAELELLGVAERVFDADGKCKGFEPISQSDQCDFAAVTETSSQNGVAVSIASLAWDGDRRLQDDPFAWHLLGKIVWDDGFDFEISDDFVNLELTGTATINPNYGQGPGDIYPNPNGLLKPWTRICSDVPWPGGCDCGSTLCGFATTGFLGAA